MKYIGSLKYLQMRRKKNKLPKNVKKKLPTQWKKLIKNLAGFSNLEPLIDG